MVAAHALRAHLTISACCVANNSASNLSRVRAAYTSQFASSVHTSSGSHYVSSTGCRSELRDVQIRRCYSLLIDKPLIAPSNILINTWIHRDRRISCIQLRQKNSDAYDSSSSNNSCNRLKPTQSLRSSQNPQPVKPKPKRRKKSHSPIHNITINHPKNSTPPTHTHLTRKQLLRLSQKQRANLKHHLIEERKASITYLDQARTNVRANLKFIKGSAESNLKKNIHTIKRLFNGEYVWKDEVAKEASKGTSDVEKAQESLQWENLPSAIQSNVKNNISMLQNWLHKVTDGAIPSPNIDKSASRSSIANRIQKFHELKQNQSLVMDNKWIAWNVLLALTPGFMVHLYCLSLQDEMKEFYSELEKKERERLLGNGIVAGDGTTGMGLSSALVSEGGSTWDKIKMAVNDLFFGGVDEKVRAASSQDIDDKSTDTDQSTPNDETLSKESTASINPNSERTQLTGSLDKDATIETLLQRIQALEKQVGIEHQFKECTAHNQIESANESPIRNRRDDYIRSQWQQQKTEEYIVPHKEEESNSLQSIIENAKNWIKLDTNLMVEQANNMCAELANSLPFWFRVVETRSHNEAEIDLTNANAADSEEPPVTECRDNSTQPDENNVVNGDLAQSNEDDTNDFDDESKTRTRWHGWWHIISRRGKKSEQKEPTSE